MVADDSGKILNCVNCFLNGSDSCKNDNDSNSNSALDDEDVVIDNENIGNDISSESTESEKKFKTYKNGEIVFFDVTLGKRCQTEKYERSWDGKDFSNSYTGYNGMGGTRTQNSCLKFYAFNDTEGSKVVNLLLDYNTTSKVVWSSNRNNKEGPKEIIDQLKQDTDGWIGINSPKIYTVDQSTTSSGTNYTVNYKESQCKSRLITAQEVSQIVGNMNWNENSEKSEWYFLSNLSQEADENGFNKPCENNKCKYGWLYDRTNSECVLHGGCWNKGDNSSGAYWTATSVASEVDKAWIVEEYGALKSGVWGIYSMRDAGVRPVIEVSKANLE